MNSQEIKQAYNNEFACLQELDTLLGQERQALKSRDTVLIGQLLEQKQALIIELESLDCQRRHLKQQAGEMTSCGNDIREFINTRDAELKKLLEQFRHQNRVNHGIVEMGRIFTRQILSILRGHAHNPGLYDPQGSHNNTDSSKSLAKV